MPVYFWHGASHWHSNRACMSPTLLFHTQQPMPFVPHCGCSSPTPTMIWLLLLLPHNHRRPSLKVLI
jgi:hypothetical protein